MFSDVEEYVKASTIQYRDAADIIEEFAQEMSEMKGKCLDIGCGPGIVTKELILPNLSPEAKLVGMDISKPMIEYAKKMYHDDERLSFQLLDIETMDLPKDTFDQFNNVLSFYCLHWCQNFRKAFDNIYKLLRPGGKGLFMLLSWNDGFDVYKKLYANPRYRPYMQDTERYIPVFHECKDRRINLRKILETTGFEILHCSEREKTYVFKNSEIMKNHIIAITPFISRIPNTLKKEFEDEITREVVNMKIQFLNKNENGEQEYNILDRYQIFVTYIRKPVC
ncbi:juvenile hormone acid O-methyltransferase [Apis dorsata]|uniref:juvenile hormone acid O-methyltransferase n=1 Tax=Apis dorsata TaxID=7462 RepID=UPI0003DF6D01|nr:juvenile hormone acid O-methyltransferase [Apis dorsata]